MKGQGTLEYLLTYGWALLIIVVVGAALYVLGVFTSNGSGSNVFCDSIENLSYDNEKIDCYLSMDGDRCACIITAYDERGFYEERKRMYYDLPAE